MVRQCNAHSRNVNTAQRAQERDEEIEDICSELHIICTVHVSPPK